MYIRKKPKVSSMILTIKTQELLFTDEKLFYS